MFAVVQQQKLPPALQVTDQYFCVRTSAVSAQAKRVHDGLGYQVLICDWREIHQPNSIAVSLDELARDLYGKSRLTDASCPSKRHQLGAREQFPDFVDLAVSTDQGRELDRQVRTASLAT